MLPKTWRLVKEKEIQMAFKKARVGHLEIAKLYLGTQNQQNFKLLIVVSKKVSKKAVFRHRIKHKISAIFEDLKKNNQLPLGHFLIVRVIDPKILRMTKSQIHDQLLPKISFLYNKLRVASKKRYINPK